MSPGASRRRRWGRQADVSDAGALLARLAVGDGFQGLGIGSKLLLHALGQVAAASRHVGFEVVVVHAIDRDAAAFYAQRGFTQFEDHDLHLFMLVKNLLATLERLSG